MLREGKGLVSLVGAGPGDPGLLTIRGRNCLAEAEVVIYDRLSSLALLVFARPDAILIDVGKGSGQHNYSQEEINRLLVEYGAAGKLVVRLKGGDPFLFGRGGEEALALAEAGVQFEIVPGVTSAIAVPAYAGIPVTHRGIAATVTVLTGHEMENTTGSRIDWQAVGRIGGTLVILMGVANLPAIVAQLELSGLNSNTPVAIIEKGATAKQRVLKGTIGNILQIVAQEGLQSPAVIIVGEVVAYSDKLQWLQNQRPLLGKQILITRPLEQSRELTELICAAGGEALICPTIRVSDLTNLQSTEIINLLPAADWLIFTSVNGVSGFFMLLRSASLDARSLSAVKFAAIGKATAKALEAHGILADFIPQRFTSADLCQELGPKLVGKKVLLLRVSDAPGELARELQSYGAAVSEYPVYKVETELRYARQITENLEQQQVDAVTFTSPSTIKGFIANINNNLALFENVKVVCIGPVTAKYAVEKGLKVTAVAENSGNQELVNTLKQVLK